jgi:hypothetical protein
MKTFTQFINEHPELQELDLDSQEFFYDSYTEDYRNGMNQLREDDGDYDPWDIF